MPPLRRLPSPRRPPPPPPFRAPTLGRLRLSAPREDGSSELDGKVRFERWDRFRQIVRLRQGEHITIIGTTGSGKTVLARELLKPRSFVAVLGTKNTDSELYGPFEALGYEITDEFDAMPDREESRIIFRPKIRTPDRKGRDAQSEAFEEMLFEVWAAGSWTVYADEIVTLTKRLNLSVTFEEFWTAGRSEHITVVASTQEPVSIPLLAFTAATHIFLFRNNDRRRIDRMADFSGADRTLVRDLIPLLPRHEFLYIDTRTGLLLRSKVILAG